MKAVPRPSTSAGRSIEAWVAKSYSKNKKSQKVQNNLVDLEVCNLLGPYSDISMYDTRYSMYQFPDRLFTTQDSVVETRPWLSAVRRTGGRTMLSFKSRVEIRG